MFELLNTSGAVALLVGVVAVIYFYTRLGRTAPREHVPSIARYFGVAVLWAVIAFALGAAIGVYAACSTSDAGNLCGLYGFLGTGPLLCGVALFLHGRSWRKRLTRGR
ncbi:MAG: hypothetical protein KIT73_05520 [Burkholderiales bacterium]|nr:hypothetical protein [Burkholderiales bacterium]